MKVKSSQGLVRVLLKHNILVGSEKPTNEAARFEAFALANFGVELSGSKANFDKDAYESLDRFFGGAKDRRGFYAHPLHTTLMRDQELLIEQLISYLGYGDWATGKRIEIFQKNFPEYVQGDKVVLRNYKVVTNEEAIMALTEVANNLLAYTRPWGIEENAEFKEIYKFLGAANFDFDHIKAKENAISLVRDGIYEAAKSMDYKDVVKMSTTILSDFQSGRWNAPKSFDEAVKRHEEEYTLIGKIIDMVHPCKLTKKQAKYFNKVSAHFHRRANHKANSPYKAATAAMKSGNVMEAAKVFAANGSLLERNLVWLLSRANPREACEILDMVPGKNPIALYQMVSGLKTSGKRTFQYRKHNLLTSYTETEYEAKWRKSVISDSTLKLLKSECASKIKAHYSEEKYKLGKVYLSDEFKNIALPTNTSASGSGMDIVPTGSKVSVNGKYIRTFVYWDGIWDIDSAAIMVKDDGSTSELSWRTYSGYSNRYNRLDLGKTAYCSGDDTSNHGVEFQDFNIDELVEKGYVYMLMSFYSFRTRTFNVPGAEVFTGYQVIDDAKTKAWDPKNNAINISVKGDGAAFLGFALDLKSRELVVLNFVRDSGNNTFTQHEIDVINRYIDGDMLKDINMFEIASSMATEIVTDPAEADVVFDRTYVTETDQTVIRPTSIDAMVALINK